MMTRFGKTAKPGGPGGSMKVSIDTRPPLVSLDVRVKAEGPGGIFRGRPKINVFTTVGVNWTVTTLAASVAIVATPSGVCRVFTTQ